MYLLKLLSVFSLTIKISETSEVATTGSSFMQRDPPLTNDQPANSLNSSIHIDAKSSRDQSYLKINEKEIYNYELIGNVKTADFHNTNNGLHLTVINPTNGKVIIKRHFFTELFGEDYGIPALLNTFSQGEILIFTVMYDAGLNLSEDVRKVFKSLGSEICFKLSYRCYCVWAFIKGGKTLGEIVTDDGNIRIDGLSSTSAFIDTFVPKLTETCWEREKGIEEGKNRMADFCSKYGGYGEFCDCDSQLNLNFPKRELVGSVIQDVPILIIASNRPHSLFRCLMTLLSQPGGHRELILVVIDGHHEQVIALLKMMNISYIENLIEEGSYVGPGGRISVHYHFALIETFRAFPSSQFVIILEEDILAAPDFLSFFNQTAPLLAADKSLYCVSAWNDLSSMHTGGNPHRIFRQENQPSYGWMLTKTFFEQVNTSWVPVDKNFDWDIWLRGPSVRGARECLIPEISRSFHLGESGVHIRGQMTFAHIAGHLTTAKENIVLENLDRLTPQEFEEDLISFLESDSVVYLETLLHSCNTNFIPKNCTKTIIIFFIMESSQDNTGWKRLSSCLGLFNLDPRDHHYGLFRFYFYGTRIFAIGYPFSHYSYLKPSFVEPVSNVMGKWDEEHLGTMALLNRKRFRVPHLEKHLPRAFPMGEPSKVPLYTFVGNSKNSRNITMTTSKVGSAS